MWDDQAFPVNVPMVQAPPGLALEADEKNPLLGENFWDLKNPRKKLRKKMLLLMVQKSGWSPTCYVPNLMKHGIFSRISSINSTSPQE